jgi:hypothetical protein
MVNTSVAIQLRKGASLRTDDDIIAKIVSATWTTPMSREWNTGERRASHAVM